VGQPGPHAAHRRWHPARASSYLGLGPSWPSEREEGGAARAASFSSRRRAMLVERRARFRRPCRVRTRAHRAARSRRRSSRCGRTQRSFTLHRRFARPVRGRIGRPRGSRHGGSPASAIDIMRHPPRLETSRRAPSRHHEDRHLGENSHLRLARRRLAIAPSRERWDLGRDHTEPTMRIATALGIAWAFWASSPPWDRLGPSRRAPQRRDAALRCRGSLRMRPHPATRSNAKPTTTANCSMVPAAPVNSWNSHARGHRGRAPSTSAVSALAFSGPSQREASTSTLSCWHRPRRSAGADPRSFIGIPEARSPPLQGPTPRQYLHGSPAVSGIVSAVGKRAAACLWRSSRRAKSIPCSSGGQTANVTASAAPDAPARWFREMLPTLAEASCTLDDGGGASMAISVPKPKGELVETLPADRSHGGHRRGPGSSGALLLAYLLARGLSRHRGVGAAGAPGGLGQAQPIEVAAAAKWPTTAASPHARDSRHAKAVAPPVGSRHGVRSRRSVAHEVKNPLAPIRAAVETLRRFARATIRPSTILRRGDPHGAHEVHRIANIVTEFTRFARLPRHARGGRPGGARKAGGELGKNQRPEDHHRRPRARHPPATWPTGPNRAGCNQFVGRMHRCREGHAGPFGSRPRWRGIATADGAAPFSRSPTWARHRPEIAAPSSSLTHNDEAAGHGPRSGHRPAHRHRAQWRALVRGQPRTRRGCSALHSRSKDARSYGNGEPAARRKCGVRAAYLERRLQEIEGHRTAVRPV